MNRIVLIASALACATAADAASITFNGTPQGPKPNPFVATGEPGITFFSFVPGGLSVVDLPAQGNGSPGLLISGDANGNFLFAQFDTPAISVSLDFGNDDPTLTAEGDVAVLFALDDSGDLLGLSTVALNRNSAMDQTITYSGAPFASFAFAFDAPDLLTGTTGPGSHGVGLAEFIDNIVFESVPVSAPGTTGAMLLGVGLLGVSWRRHRRPPLVG